MSNFSLRKYKRLAETRKAAKRLQKLIAIQTAVTPFTYNPWLANPGNAIMQSAYFIKTTYGGLNKCMAINTSTGWVLPNCTGYAWGRVCYLLGGADPALPTYDANQWYGNSGGSFNTWTRSQTPTLGAVACWDDGNHGHVAVVEYIHYTSGTTWDYFTVSESGYSGSWTDWGIGGCRNATVYASNLGRWSGYSFQGFINTPSNLIVQ